MKQRIYLVTHNKGHASERWLVRAPSRQAAVNHIARRDFTAELAEQDTLVQMLKGGHQVEEAREQQTDLVDEQQEDAA